jgi:hypothetical protein
MQEENWGEAQILSDSDLGERSEVALCQGSTTIHGASARQQETDGFPRTAFLHCFQRRTVTKGTLHLAIAVLLAVMLDRRNSLRV